MAVIAACHYDGQVLSIENTPAVLDMAMAF